MSTRQPQGCQQSPGCADGERVLIGLDEPIIIKSYDPTWAEWFVRERNRLCQSLSIGPSQIEHIGSTAVPGMSAKPVVDILLGLTYFPPSPSAAERLRADGYEAFGEAGVPGRHYFRRRGPLNCNVQAVLFGGPLWNDNVLFRDYLRAHPAAARRYADAKQRALDSGHRMLLAYSAAKAEIIAQLLTAARQDDKAT